MRKTTFATLLSVIVMVGGIVAGCNNAATENTAAETNDSTAVDAVETYFSAIDRFLTDSIGSQYAEAEMCIPFNLIVGVDETNADDIKVWGDFWVMNYNLVGDTLKAVSGGSHPGLMHVRQDGEHFEVTGFDAVGDGSNYEPTAKSIFGEKYGDLQKITSDVKNRENVRLNVVAAYVKRNNVKATMYQDYGWHPVSLSKE